VRWRVASREGLFGRFVDRLFPGLN